MPICPLSARVLGPAIVCIVVSMFAWPPGISGHSFLIASAQEQSKQQDPLEKARTAVETLINRLRGRDMPEGIVKTNGRIQATQVDVSAKYSGRLSTVNVDEGDEVTAGQVVATISSPETEAKLREAQANLLKAKKSLAEAVANIAQRNSDLDFTRTDYNRGKRSEERRVGKECRS